MDAKTLDSAAAYLMDEIYARMTGIREDFMFEFRQNYVGAQIVNRCNMLRVGDCAADPITNRIGIASLRLLNGGTAIHSDMLLWGKHESPLNCRRQLLNILFSVPQISVRLTEIPGYQLDLIRRYTEYWTENRDTLMHGTFSALRPESNYTVMSAEDEDKKITVLHGDPVFTPSGKREDVFNDTACDFIVSSGGAFEYEIYDMFNDLLCGGKTDGHPCSLDVPRGGMLRICK